MDTFGHDLQRFAAIKTPTLLVVGELSPPWLTDTSRRLQQAIPHSTIVTIPGQAHDAFLTDPPAMAEAILPFALGRTEQATMGGPDTACTIDATPEPWHNRTILDDTTAAWHIRSS